MSCGIKCGREYCDRYDHDADAIALACSLVDKKIVTTSIIENGSRAFLVLTLDDGRIINVGVAGNLHDEAYLFFAADRKQ